MLQKNISKEYESVSLAGTAFSNDKVNQQLLDSFPYPAMLISKQRVIIAANKAAKENGIQLNTFCWDTFGKRESIADEDREFFEEYREVPESGIKCVFCKADKALEKRKSVCQKIELCGLVYETYWAPITDSIFLHFAIVNP